MRHVKICLNLLEASCGRRLAWIAAPRQVFEGPGANVPNNIFCKKKTNQKKKIF